MTIRLSLATTALLTVLVGCAGNDIQTSSSAYVPAASLASYQTYALSPKRTLTLRDPSLNTTALRGWLDTAVETTLAGKGYTKGSPETADLLVSYAAGSRTIVGSRNYSARNEWSGSRLDEEGALATVLAPNRTLDTDYEEGRLNLDLLERKSGKIAFRGSTTVAMLKQPTPEKSVARINRMVQGMLKDLPRR